MDRRKDTRIEIDQTAALTLLGQAPRQFSGRVVNISGRGMQLVLDEQVPVGAAVRVDGEDMLLLGEVCYCVPRGRQFVAGLALEHSLRHLQDLSDLMRALLGESRGPGRRSRVNLTAQPRAK